MSFWLFRGRPVTAFPLVLTGWPWDARWWATAVIVYVLGVVLAASPDDDRRARAAKLAWPLTVLFAGVCMAVWAAQALLSRWNWAAIRRPAPAVFWRRDEDHHQ